MYRGGLGYHGAKLEMTREFVESSKNSDPIAVIIGATNTTNSTISLGRKSKANCRASCPTLRALCWMSLLIRMLTD